MHIHRTDLNLLVIFECVYTQGSVTRAAEVLHVTQPSVSQSLARLRERIDDPLFVRHGKKLVPTPVAEQMIGPVRQSLGMLEDSLEGLKSFDPASASQRFAIGLRPLMEGTIYPQLRRTVLAQAPRLKLSSVQFDRQNLDAELRSGNLSLALDVFLPLPDDINRKLLFTAPLVVVGRPNHPAFVNGEISLERYLQQEHLQASSRSEGRSVEDIMLARLGLHRQVVSRCQNVATAIEVILESDLLLTVSESFIRQQRSSHNLSICEVPFELPNVETYLYWHNRNDNNKASQWLRQLIEEGFGKFTLE